ncbi:uncharacterized protein A1O9_08265 [Exophiala aquamarina CBS 119918]|uniref:Protection of telomeres protein 1 n=1 Tax=Exophiala aquamarina CBS 119918 TaxID=1182545 RepID=A0A072PJ01_9EURO|nr:uncharacterized protein A1O9_08265 [Exophiala aquamarina CBS 119918]KEF55515.1 hypothetical protein A1O9_08265 [Exophiala aquamarina CBS 119918]
MSASSPRSEKGTITPPNYVDLSTAERDSGRQQSVIGVCIDFLPATKTRGTDYTIKFTLHDPTWNGAGGMEFRFFHKKEACLPRIENQGDVVILRNVKTMDWNGRVGLSGYNTEWIVLPKDAMSGTLDDLKAAARCLQQSSANDPKSSLSTKELQYASYISGEEDPTRWRTSCSVVTGNNMGNSGAEATPRKRKFTEIKDIQVPFGKQGIFVELLGEVIRIFSKGDRTELYITDYTSHPQLYNYTYGCDEDGQDGDEFGYIEHKVKSWPGPWGTMTMNVTLWDANHYYAVDNVRVGGLVYLRNVHISLDSDGKKLEGKCHGEKDHPTRVNVKRWKANSEDQLMKDLLSRKQTYEAKHPKKRLGADDEEHPPQEDSAPKSKKARARDRKKKKHRESKPDPDQETIKTSLEGRMPLRTLNENVRCQNHEDVRYKTIADILDPTTLQRTTPTGNGFCVPFQNCKYKSKVRVVDFFPDNVEDFAVPREEPESENNDPSELDGSDSDAESKKKWVWRFFLLVEDAQHAPKASNRGDIAPVQMQLLVADTDGEFLLDQIAYDMRDPQNKTELVRTKERLFHLWGDLQEWKEETRTTAASADVEMRDETTRTPPPPPKARPFECLIKEYGATVPSHLRASSGNERTEYERMFRMFGVRTG